MNEPQTPKDLLAGYSDASLQAAVESARTDRARRIYVAEQARRAAAAVTEAEQAWRAAIDRDPVAAGTYLGNVAFNARRFKQDDSQISWRFAIEVGFGMVDPPEGCESFEPTVQELQAVRIILGLAS